MQSVADVIRASKHASSLRRRVLESAFFENHDLNEIVSTPWSLEKFLSDCRLLPQCGEMQVAIIRKILAERLPDESRPAPDFHVDATAGVHFCYANAVEDVFLRFWRESYAHRFVYLPSSVPEMAKSEAVLRAELPPQADPSGYAGKIAAIRRASSDIDRAVNGCVLLNQTSLDSIFSRRHRYAGLCDQDLALQKRLIRDSIADFPGVDFRVIDYERFGVSPAWLSDRVSVVHAMGGYMVIEDTAIAETLIKRCSDALAVAEPLKDHVAICA